MPHTPPAVRAEISRACLTGNFTRLRSLLLAPAAASGCGLLIAVSKGNAYGHDISLCAPWLAECGAEWLGVTSVEEGATVRRLCPAQRILVMRGLLYGETDLLLDARLIPTVWTPEHLEWLGAAAQRRGLDPSSIPIHLELDTGMSRQGAVYPSPALRSFLKCLRAIPELRLDGIFTHFASPENPDSVQNAEQFGRFESTLREIAMAGFRPRWVHAGNSSTLLGMRMLKPLRCLAEKIGAALLVRPGIALFGYALPFEGPGYKDLPLPVPLEPVMSLISNLASVREVEAGARVGYSGSFVAPSRMRLGLLPIGYADGLSRRLSNCGHVLIRGQAAPIVGRVSMDLTLVDISAIPGAAPGDEAVLLGRQGELRITVDDHARWADTISYEILCGVAARVPRVPVA